MTGQARREAVAAIDRQVGAVLGRLPAGTSLLLAGLSDTTGAAHLHVAIARGPSPAARRTRPASSPPPPPARTAWSPSPT
nr:hypothetical protein GCM10020093_077140 [Planobispora longispora]